MREGAALVGSLEVHRVAMKPHRDLVALAVRRPTAILVKIEVPGA